MKTISLAALAVLICAAFASANPIIMAITTLDNGGFPALGSGVLGAYSTDGGATWTADGNCGPASTYPVYSGNQAAVDSGASTFCGFLGGGPPEPVSSLVVFYSGTAAGETDPANWDAAMEVFLQTAILVENPTDLVNLEGSGDFNVNSFFGDPNMVIYVPDPPILDYNSSTGTEFILNDSQIGTPEPGSLLLLGPACGLLGLWRRRKTAH